MKLALPLEDYMLPKLELTSKEFWLTHLVFLLKYITNTSEEPVKLPNLD